MREELVPTTGKVFADGHHSPKSILRSSRRESDQTSPGGIMSGFTSAAASINEDEDGGVLGGFDDLLKLPVSRDRHFEFG